jgi:hypothetical protein
MRYNIKFSLTVEGETSIKFEVHYVESKYKFYETVIDLLKEKYPEGIIKILKTREAVEGVSHGV